MSRDNGLLRPMAFRNPTSAYYLDNKSEIVLTEPILVSPVVLKSADLESQSLIVCRGLDGAVPGPFTGAIKLIPGSSSVGTAAEGITVRSVGGGTQLLVGTDSETPNTVVVAGANGISEVYNQLYNPVIKGTAVASASGALPGTAATRSFTFTPTITGAYMLQVNLNVRNADFIPLDGFIEYVLSAAAQGGGVEVQFVSNTFNSNQLIKVFGMDEINGVLGGVAEPTDFSNSDLCILQAGVQVSFNILTARNSTVGGESWAIQNYQARLIQMC